METFWYLKIGAAGAWQIVLRVLPGRRCLWNRISRNLGSILVPIFGTILVPENWRHSSVTDCMYGDFCVLRACVWKLINLVFEIRWRVGSCMGDQPGPSLRGPLHSPGFPGVPWGADPNLQDFNIILYEPGEAPPPRNLPKINSFICLFSTSLGDSTSLVFPQQSWLMVLLYESGGGFAFPKTDSKQPYIFMNVLFSTSLAALPETSPE